MVEDRCRLYSTALRREADAGYSTRMHSNSGEEENGDGDGDREMG